MDRIIRATAGDGFIKMAAIDARNTVQRARDIHNCTPTASAALGRTLCAASLMGDMMKEENASLTIRVSGGGPIGSVIAVSDSGGNVRGCVGDPLICPSGPMESWTWAALWAGTACSPSAGTSA